jgi:hypothetical protein
MARRKYARKNGKNTKTGNVTNLGFEAMETRIEY